MCFSVYSESRNFCLLLIPPLKFQIKYQKTRKGKQERKKVDENVKMIYLCSVFRHWSHFNLEDFLISSRLECSVTCRKCKFFFFGGGASAMQPRPVNVTNVFVKFSCTFFATFLLAFLKSYNCHRSSLRWSDKLEMFCLKCQFIRRIEEMIVMMVADSLWHSVSLTALLQS